jgi:flagellar hook-associated protein 2
MAIVGSVSGITAKTGIGGLSSGMDIDSLILKMTAARRTNITKQEQSLQKLEWKQSAYRSVTKALTEFRDKYFNSLSATNFKGSAMFNTIRASLPEDVKAFTATAQSSASIGKAYVNKIEQLATNQTISSKIGMTAPLSGTAQVNSSLNSIMAQAHGHDKDFLVTLDGVSRTVMLDNQFRSDLGEIVKKDLIDNHSYVDGTPALNSEIDRIMNSVNVADRPQKTNYLSKALQAAVNRLFENPPTPTAPNLTPTYEDYLDPQKISAPKVMVSITNDYRIAFNVQPDSNSKLTLGYATGLEGVRYERDTEHESLDVHKARVEAEEAAAHLNTGLGVLGFTDRQSNRLDINKSINDLTVTGGGLGTGLFVDGKPTGAVDPNTGQPVLNQTFSFIINDVRFSVDPDESLLSVMNRINSSSAGVTLSYSEVTDKFTLTAKTSGEGENIVLGDMNRDFLWGLGVQHVETRQPSANPIHPAGVNSKASVSYGSNAIVYIDGQRIERMSNEFTVNSVSYSLKETYNTTWTPTYAVPNDTTSRITNATEGGAVTLAPDTTDLMESVKNFVTDYNALVDLLHGLTNEEVFSDYEPLTEEQRAAMSESQIKLWEEKSKSGMLRGDAAVNKILASLREAALTTSDGFGLLNMGVTYGNATDSWKSYGKLTITDERRLKATLDAQPDRVRDFFTNASKGVATKIDKIIDDAVRTSGGAGRRGSLIEIAGLPATMSEDDNAIYTQMVNHNKRINDFKIQLEREESRLWAQFSAMETALSKMNEQTSILSQYLGTGNKS